MPGIKKHRLLIIIWVFEEYNTYFCSVRCAIQEKKVALKIHHVNITCSVYTSFWTGKNG